MKDKVLHGQLSQRMKAFYEEYFEQAPENRFEHFLPAGVEAFPVLLDALDNDVADSEVRTDALIAIGRLFREHGPTSESLDVVVVHAKRLSQTGFTSERQAALFALGSSRADTLINGFLPLLESDKPDAINVACYVVGYAKWDSAVTALVSLAKNGTDETRQAAAWALGEIGNDVAVDTLLELLGNEESMECAVDALSNAGNQKAMEPLSKLLGHDSIAIRMGAVHGIRSAVIDHKEAILASGAEWLYEPLKKAATDEASPVAVFAMLTLAELGQKVDQEVAYRVFSLQEKQAIHAAN